LASAEIIDVVIFELALRALIWIILPSGVDALERAAGTKFYEIYDKTPHDSLWKSSVTFT